jgi:hypothetical protein
MNPQPLLKEKPGHLPVEGAPEWVRPLHFRAAFIMSRFSSNRLNSLENFSL